MAAKKRKVEEQQALAGETKNMGLEIIDDDTFFKRLKKKNNEHKFSNEYKHYLLGLDDHFKL